jgi:hypothetical protein
MKNRLAPIALVVTALLFAAGCEKKERRACGDDADAGVATIDLKDMPRLIEAALPTGWSVTQNGDTLIVRRNDDVLFNRRIIVEGKESTVLADVKYEIHLRFTPKLSAEDYAEIEPKPQYATADFSVYLTIPTDAQGTMYSADDAKATAAVAEQIKKLLAPHPGAGAAGKPGAAVPAKATVGSDGSITFGRDKKHSIKVPATWTTEEPANNMRLLQVRVPKAAEDTEGAELTVIKATGGVEANIARWKGQFGGEAALIGQSKETTASGSEATIAELEGNYAAMNMDGSQSTKESYKMLAAIVVTDNGEYYIKMPGPRATVDANKDNFKNLVKSFK